MNASAARATLARFLAGDRERASEADGLHELVAAVARACRLIACAARRGALASADGVPARDELSGALDAAVGELLRHAATSGAGCAGMLTESMPSPCAVPGRRTTDGYLLVLNRLDAPDNFRVNLCAGTLFAVFRAPRAGGITAADFLQPAGRMVAAGYALYGPATTFVLSLGAGVDEFTLDPRSGEFLLTRRNLRIPGATAQDSAQALLPGMATGTRARDGLVGETHRVLLRGGLCPCPGGARGPVAIAGPRLLHEAGPIAFLVEQAGGGARAGRARVLDLVPDALHGRINFVFGAIDEVERFERDHRGPPRPRHDAPLFNLRGLFRPSL